MYPAAFDQFGMGRLTSGGGAANYFGEGIWQRGMDYVFGEGTSARITTFFTEDIPEAVEDIVVTAQRIIGDVFNPRTPNDRALITSARTDGRLNQRPPAPVRTSTVTRATSGSSWFSLPSFEWPSVRWNQMASRLPSLDAGIQARMNGADSMEVSIAQREGTRNYMAQGLGNLAFGHWETNLGFVSTAAAPPTVLLTERSSSPYVRGGGRAGVTSSPWLSMVGEAFIASRLIAPMTRGLAAEGAVGAGPVVAYNRAAHYGRTPTAADRVAVGAGSGEVADHTPPLVQRYYQGDPLTGERPGWQMTPAERAASASDRSRMSSQPRADSDSQGGQMSAYSREMRRKYGL